MKGVLNRFGLLLAGGLLLQAFPARANFEVSAGVSIGAVSDFYGPLEGNGAWVNIGSYGRCWHPTGVPADWRPYCSGQWVWTDCGWYWQSEEPWAWACYHYGNWAYDPGLGWFWVPGVEWAPAWVSWRMGAGYVGWAPLGPRGVVYAGSQYVFVENARFGRPIQRNEVVINNTVVINKTRVVNNVRQESRVVAGTKRTVMVNDGPGLAALEKASGRRFDKQPIQQVAERSRVPSGLPRENAVRRSVAKSESPSPGPVAPQAPAPKTEVQPTASMEQSGKPGAHPNRPGENREPTTRWWTPAKKSKPEEKPVPPPTAPANTRQNEIQRPLVSPAPKPPVAPAPVQPQPQPRSEPEQRPKP